jgi:lipoxygenase homology domain-containing protein 1
MTVTYQVRVKTGSMTGAGTDADVSIVLYGDKASSGPIPLDNAMDNFEAGSEDLFTIETTDLGELVRCEIGHNDEGLGSGWYLEKVTVHDPTTGRAWAFLANRWLATDEGDGKTTCTLTVSR